MFNKGNKIVVIGAGPAGIMAAIRASQISPNVTLIEKNSCLGKKLLLSGKGRCNLTNACNLDLFLERFSGRGEFLRDAFKKFFNRDLMNFFESRGLKLNIERQLRVFPATNSSVSIVEVLNNELQKNKVNVLYKTIIKDILVEQGKVTGILLQEGGVVGADKVILATGGVSYSFTGSTGEGLKICQRLGHRITPLKAGLAPWELKQTYPRRLQGLTLKNIQLKVGDGKKEINSQIGELVFTNTGISGPLVFSLCAKVGDWEVKKNNLYLEIDLKPALSLEQLDKRMIREFKDNPKKTMRNILKNLLPLRMIDLFMEILKMPTLKAASHITAGERGKIVSLLKRFRIDIKGLSPIEQAMVTRGGVSLKEINPRTMESRIIQGLYFCGEIMNIDADTGGFNLQAAFSSGYLAGESAA